MPRKRRSAEEIVAKLRQVDVLSAQGWPVAEAIRSMVNRQGLAGLALGTRRQDGLHRTRQPVGERLLRELQRQTP
jgi:hypothetical protein